MVSRRDEETTEAAANSRTFRKTFMFVNETSGDVIEAGVILVGQGRGFVCLLEIEKLIH